jgi:hypothetical protein
MSLILSGTDGLSDVDGSAATPAIRGTDSNTGIFFPAADTIAFAEGGVESARFDSAGNFGVGTTIPASFGKLAVNGVASMLTNGLVRFYNSANNNWSFIDNPSTDGSAFLRFATGAGEAARIDSSGNLLVGTTSNRASSKLDIRGDVMTLGSNASFFATIDYSAGAGLLSIAAESGGGIAFKSGTTERMRIDSSGDLLVGNSSKLGGGIGGIDINKSSGPGLTLGVSGTARSFFYINSSNTDSTWETVVGVTARVISGLSGGVGLANGATSWAAISDERLKTSVTPFQGALQKVGTLRAGTGRYLSDAESVSRSFLVAQDVQAVLPEAVDVAADEQGTLSLRYTDTIPLLVAAIQEQQVLIQEIKAELAALKGAA